MDFFHGISPIIYNLIYFPNIIEYFFAKKVTPVTLIVKYYTKEFANYENTFVFPIKIGLK
jgi:hypothetical protein